MCSYLQELGTGPQMYSDPPIPNFNDQEQSGLHIIPETGVMSDYVHSLMAATGALVTLMEEDFDVGNLEDFVGFAQNIITYSEYLERNFATIYGQNIGFSEGSSDHMTCLGRLIKAPNLHEIDFSVEHIKISAALFLLMLDVKILHKSEFTRIFGAFRELYHLIYGSELPQSLSWIDQFWLKAVKNDNL